MIINLTKEILNKINQNHIKDLDFLTLISTQFKNNLSNVYHC